MKKTIADKIEYNLVLKNQHPKLKLKNQAQIHLQAL